MFWFKKKTVLKKVLVEYLLTSVLLLIAVMHFIFKDHGTYAILYFYEKIILS